MARQIATDTLATTDHDTIRGWTEERGGVPVRVEGTGSGDDPGVLRIDFPDYPGEEALEPISWDDWFEKFDGSDLAFLYREEDPGETSYFNKLVDRESVSDRL